MIGAANILIITLASAILSGFTVQLVLGQIDLGSAAFFGILAGAYVFAATIAWRNLGVLHSIVQPWTVTSLLTLFAVTFGFVLLLILGGALEGIDWKDRTQAGPLLSGFLNYSFTAILSLGAVCAILIARRKRIRALDLSVRDLTKNLETYVRGQGEVRHVPGKAPYKGYIMLGIGIAWMIGLQLVPDEIFFSQSFSHVAGQISGLGFLFFLYAKYYFQPDAKALLNSDRRPPILFLRSFTDDEKKAYARGARALFDFSLESRLGGHFAKIGPFIAVGSPKDSSPMLGAVRAKLSDDEWQGVVLGWMDASRLVILMAGSTQWVVWELSKVVQSGHVGKLIVMFPQVRRFFGRRKDADARLNATRQAFSGSKWSDALASELVRPQDIRALVFGADGTLDLITSRPRGRTSYQIAALVAHYVLLRQSVGLSESVTTSPAAHETPTSACTSEPGPDKAQPRFGSRISALPTEDSRTGAEHFRHRPGELGRELKVGPLGNVVWRSLIGAFFGSVVGLLSGYVLFAWLDSFNVGIVLFLSVEYAAVGAVALAMSGEDRRRIGRAAVATGVGVIAGFLFAANFKGYEYNFLRAVFFIFGVPSATILGAFKFWDRFGRSH